LRFADSDSSNWVAFQSPATVASNVTWTLPATDGTSNQALVTNGSGALSWATASASPGGSSTELQYNNAGAFGGISGVTSDGTRITASTTIGVGGATPSTSGSGISFPATASASSDANTLDDYEEGTFSPTIANGVSTPPTSYTVQAGRYTKIGRFVFLNIQIDAVGAVASGATLGIGNFPFTTASGDPQGSGAIITLQESFNTNAGDTLYVQGGNVRLDFYTNAGVGRAGNSAGVNVNNLVSINVFYTV
jgi:hypothetical protein